MADTADFSKLLTGFDFLQSMVKNAGSAMPGISNWVTPTLDPEELDKRIQELKTVQFWLEQNAKMLGASIQAMEVQRMTLVTLRAMNVQTSELAEAFRMKDPPAAAAAADPEPEPDPAPPAAEATSSGSDPSGEGDAPGLVDPMQWWGSLTQQFGELAQKALNDDRLREAMNLGVKMAKAGAEPAKTPSAARKKPRAPAPAAAKKAASAPKRAAKTAAQASPRRSRA